MNPDLSLSLICVCGSLLSLPSPLLSSLYLSRLLFSLYLSLSLRSRGVGLWDDRGDADVSFSRRAAGAGLRFPIEVFSPQGDRNARCVCVCVSVCVLYGVCVLYSVCVWYIVCYIVCVCVLYSVCVISVCVLYSVCVCVI